MTELSEMKCTVYDYNQIFRPVRGGKQAKEYRPRLGGYTRAALCALIVYLAGMITLAQAQSGNNSNAITPIVQLLFEETSDSDDGCIATSIVSPITGSATLQSNQFGSFYQYIPGTVTQNSKILIIAHGTPGTAETALDSALTFINRWTDTAEQESVIVLAPVFDQTNFGGKSGGYGGYRGLYGRNIGADEFVHQIICSYAKFLPSHDGRFFLYGHSAGGQFVNRYLVKHPDRTIRSVISAAGRYAYPNPTVKWHYGMAPLIRTIEWENPSEAQMVNITPDPNGWLEAAQLPVTVVVGDLDTEPQPSRPGQIGTTRIEIGQNWVNEMNTLASNNGVTGSVMFVLVTGVGHSSSGLTPASQAAMFP